jgi:hypothetical protein
MGIHRYDAGSILFLRIDGAGLPAVTGQRTSVTILDVTIAEKPEKAIHGLSRSVASCFKFE